MLWLLGGVTPRDIGLFLAYHMAFVVAPGVAVYAALCRQRQRLVRVLALGWGLGFVLEALAFTVSGATEQWVFVAYPPVMILGGVLVRRWRGADRLRDGAQDPALDSRFGWGTAGVCIAVLVVLAAAALPPSPLPGDVAAVDYDTDSVWQLAIAGEAKHHWPITNAPVAGKPLPYYTFAFQDLAGASRVTGIDLPILLFRLAPLTLAAAAVLMFGVVGSSLSRRRRVGPIAAGLVFLTGELDLDLNQANLFHNTFFTGFYISLTFALGLVLFVGSVLLLWDRMSSSRMRSEVGPWIVTVLFLVGCGGAKGSTLPVLAAGICGYAAWRFVASRRVDWRPLVALAAVGLVLAYFYLRVYGDSAPGIQIALIDLVKNAPAIHTLHSVASSPLREDLFWPLATLVAFVAMIGAALAGIPFASERGWLRPQPRQVFVLALLLGGLVPAYLLGHPGNAEKYFLFYGLAAGALLSAEGLERLWTRFAPGPRPTRLLITGLAIWLIGVAAAAVVFDGLLDEPDPAVMTVREVVVWLAILATGPALALAVIPLLRRIGIHWRWGVVAAVSTVVAAGTLDQVFDTGPGLMRNVRNGTPVYSSSERMLTSQLYSGFLWIRDNTPVDSVLAVKKRTRLEQPERYFYLSAFSERRVFLDGWIYTAEALRAGADEVVAGSVDPFPGRTALNRSAFAGDRGAIEKLNRRWGVDYLVVDKVHSRPSNLRSVGRLVFSNDDLDVYAVDSSRHKPAHSRCGEQACP